MGLPVWLSVGSVVLVVRARPTKHGDNRRIGATFNLSSECPTHVASANYGSCCVVIVRNDASIRFGSPKMTTLKFKLIRYRVE